MRGAAALALIVPVGAGQASLDDRSAILAYAKARAADSFGDVDDAARAYAAALALAPDNDDIAARALSEAIAAGDRPLALSAARRLEGVEPLAPNARVLLLSEALRKKDYKRAGQHVDAIEKDQVFAFMAPVLRAWIAFDARQGDPLALLAAGASNPLAAAYAAEHRPLMLIALGQKDAGVAELLKLTETGGGRASRLRIAGAALLARKGDRDRAMTLLAGDAAPLIAARALVEARKPLPGAIEDASSGIGEFLVRIAIDLHRQQISELGLTYARFATFLAPDNSETWLVTSEILGALDQPEAARAALANVAANDPFAGNASDARVKLLSDGSDADKAEALAEAQARTRIATVTVTDWTRLGDLLSALDRFEEAAAAYGEALALRPTRPDGQPEWALWLLRGGALDRAGHWPQARAALEASYKLAPDQPVVLNYLGYAQLERRENLVEAAKLIAEASRLQPDDPSITDSLGWAHYLRGELAKAVELLERAARGQPADAAINEHLGDAYYSAGRRYEARYAWRAALLSAEDKAAERLRAKIVAGLTPALASP